jgi:hypothetical protein
LHELRKPEIGAVVVVELEVSTTRVVEGFTGKRTFEPLGFESFVLRLLALNIVISRFGIAFCFKLPLGAQSFASNWERVRSFKPGRNDAKVLKMGKV